MPARCQKTNQIFYFILPLVLAILIMAPRLASPQFGLLDDGAMLAEVRQILLGDLGMSHDLQAGRFRPLYWGVFHPDLFPGRAQPALVFHQPDLPLMDPRARNPGFDEENGHETLAAPDRQPGIFVLSAHH